MVKGSRIKTLSSCSLGFHVSEMANASNLQWGFTKVIILGFTRDSNPYNYWLLFIYKVPPKTSQQSIFGILMANQINPFGQTFWPVNMNNRYLHGHIYVKCHERPASTIWTIGPLQCLRAHCSDTTEKFHLTLSRLSAWLWPLTSILILLVLKAVFGWGRSNIIMRSLSGSKGMWAVGVIWNVLWRGSSVVEYRTLNRRSPGSNARWHCFEVGHFSYLHDDSVQSAV